MKNLIFETLITEASKAVTRLTSKGMDLDRAINEVANDMVLDSLEIDELTSRKKKTAKAAPIPVVEDAEEEISIEVTEPNQIQFATADQLEAAIGVLMYKSIPWVNRTEVSVTFQNAEEMEKAHNALKRRWDFVNLQKRTAAVLEFDNLEDYAKVLEFLSSKNMTVLQGDISDLDDDLDLERATAEVLSSDAEGDDEIAVETPAVVVQELSYSALYKESLIDPKTLDVLSDAGNRSLRVVKRWK